MEETSTYDTNILGGIGEEYSRLLAIRLLTAATLAERGFKLAIEFKAGDKFDDVAFYDEAAREWWLIQAKHSVGTKELTREAMFPERGMSGDFVMAKYFKSYLGIRQQWRFGGERVRLVLFTNRGINECVEGEEVAVDGALQFCEGRHVRLRPEVEDVRAMKNQILDEIVDGFVKLFRGGDGRVINALGNHRKIVVQVLTREGKSLRFSENFLGEQLEGEFFDKLRLAFIETDMSTLSVKVPAKFPDVWSDTLEESEGLQSYIEDSTVEAFFDDLVLSVEQPNVKKLVEGIQHDWQRWMKSWIRPDVYRKLTESQLQEPYNAFKKNFDQWERSDQIMKTRTFLTHEQSKSFLKMAKVELDSYVRQYGRQGYIGLDAAEKYYVERWITVKKQQDAEIKLNAEEFVSWLCEDWNDQNCFAVFAEPGMGKSTLWQHLAFRTQLAYEDVEVFLIYLNDFKEQLRTIDKNTSVEDAVQIMKLVISEVNFEVLLGQDRKVVIFMDAFDELKEDNKQPLLNFINLLGSHKRYQVKFLISSRERCKRELSRNLPIETIDLVPFDADNRRSFLRSFWGAEDTTRFNEFSKELLRRFESDVPRGDLNFIGLPLTMKMLAEIFQESYDEYSKTPEDTDLTSILPKASINVCYLYEQFIKKCISLTLNKKWRADMDVATHLKQFLEQNYQLLAVKQMKLGAMIEEHQRVQLEDFRKSIQKGHEESLLLETVNGSTRFSHRSYAEFLCAKYLFDRIGATESAKPTLWKRMFNFEESSTVKCLKNVFKQERVIRKFYLKMLSEKFENDPTIERHLKILKKIGAAVEIWACEDNCGPLLATVQNGSNLRTINGYETTLLHVAAKSNACEAMEVLLKTPQNIDIEDHSRKTPLFVACEEGHLDMVRLLLGRGAKYEDTTSLPLHIAVKKGHLEVVRLLVERGADVEQRDSWQCTALHYAASHGKVAIVEFLLECGASLEARDSFGRTPLYHATRANQRGIVKLLGGCSAEM